MRTYDEIDGDVYAARSRGDGPALRALADELMALQTPEAEAAALAALGTAEGYVNAYASALAYFGRALKAYEDLRDQRGIAMVEILRCTIHNDASEYQTALSCYERARSLYEQLGDRKNLAVVTGNMGNVHAYTGDYAQALVCYSTALAVHEELGNRPAVADVTGNMGTLYSQTGEHELALTSYRRSQSLCEELGDRVGVAWAINNIGSTHHRIGEYALALDCFRQTASLYEALGIKGGVATATGNIGNVFSSTGDHPQALEYYYRALPIHQEVGNLPSVARITSNIGNVYSITGDHAAALDCHRQAIALHGQIGNRLGVATSTANLGIAYERMGDLESALDHLRQALSVYRELGARSHVIDVSINMVATLLRLGHNDEASAYLNELDAMSIDTALARASHAANHASFAERAGDVDAAQTHLLNAVAITTEAGLRPESAMYHLRLRDLAQARNDFAGYIHHNNEHARITEEVSGRQATQRLAMMAADRAMESERREREKERALLYGALPENVATRILQGDDVTNDQFEHAAVLFVDVVDFTVHTATMHPADVVKLLDTIFNTLDAICTVHDVIKIKTIGDSYMCFRGDADASTNALSIARVALDAMHSAFMWPNGETIRVRAGIHIGPATAGVIGTQRLQYDVWGDTVNVASRMESTGEPGRIHVSDTFAQHLTADTMTLLPRGVVDVKGKGAMHTYWLVSP